MRLLFFKKAKPTNKVLASTSMSVSRGQIEVGENKVDKHYVLIDDDLLIRMGWEAAAQERNIRLDTFESAEEFLEQIENYNVETYIYIDSVLGGTIKGQDLAKSIHTLGYKKIYLATNYDHESFRDLTWIQGVQGKNPPF